MAEKEKKIFKYEQQSIKVTQLDIFPAIYPLLKQTNIGTFQIKPSLPTGLTFDKKSGAIYGYTTLETKPGKVTHKIGCTIDGVPYRAFIEIEIEKCEAMTPPNIWMVCDKQSTSSIVQNINVKLHTTKIMTASDIPVKSYKFKSFPPFKTSLPSGIDFDSRKGLFRGIPTEIKKCTFRIRIEYENHTKLVSPLFLIDVTEGKQDKLKRMKHDEIIAAAKEYKDKELNPESAYQLFANTAGLNFENFLKTVLILGKLITNKQAQKLFDSYQNSNHIDWETFQKILDSGKLKDITWPALKQSLEIAFGDLIVPKDEFTEVVTKLGDKLDGGCLDDVYKTLDENNTGQLDTTLLEKYVPK